MSLLQEIQNSLNNSNLILRLWNSDIKWYQEIITARLGWELALAMKGRLSRSEIKALAKKWVNLDVLAVSLNKTISHGRMGEVQRSLMESDFFRVLVEASRESVELSNFVEGVLKRLGSATGDVLPN